MAKVKYVLFTHHVLAVWKQKLWLLSANADYKSSMTVNEDNLLFIIDLYLKRNCHTHKYPPDGDNIAIQVYNL